MNLTSVAPSCLRKTVLAFATLAGAIFSTDLSLLAEERTWTSSDGRTLVGEIQGLEGDSVKLKTATGVFEFPLDRLSEADQKFAKEWKESSQPDGVPEGAPKDAADRTVGDFSELQRGEWPKSVSADFDVDEIKVIKEDEEAGEYIYRSPHFEFQTPDRLSTSVVRESTSACR